MSQSQKKPQKRARVGLNQVERRSLCIRSLEARVAGLSAIAQTTDSSGLALFLRNTADDISIGLGFLKPKGKKK